MAYRFLLEVPERLAEDASLVVDQAGDAQVVVERPSHGLGVDAPYLDLTTAAHSLRVIEMLGDWYGGLPEPRPNVGIVLHGGERYSLGEMSPKRIVALIRHDQPWVERSIPHVGDHEPERCAFWLLDRCRCAIGGGGNRAGGHRRSGSGRGTRHYWRGSTITRAPGTGN